MPDIEGFGEEGVYDDLLDFARGRKGGANSRDLEDVQSRTEEVFRSKNLKGNSSPHSQEPFIFNKWYREHVDPEAVDYSEKDRLEAFSGMEQTIGSKERPNEASLSKSAWFERNTVSVQSVSQKLPTLGIADKQMLILGVNGIATSLEEALSHQAYIKSLISEDVGVDFIYNHSNSPPVDILEMVALNYFGFSPNVGKMLKDSWAQFHENNKDYPERKILQICHSQGAIHVFNAIQDSPKEITDRLIVLSIAPAKIIPNNSCCQSIKVASDKDKVHLVELLHPGFFDSNEVSVSEPLKKTFKERCELTLLDPHPDAVGLDHAFQSPTFRPILEFYLQTYLSNHKQK